VAERLPGIRSRVLAELAAVPYLTAPDSSLVERYCFLCAQAEVIEDYFMAIGGFLSEAGKAHPSTTLYTSLVHRIEGLAKVLGLGPNPRTQVLQGMANTGKELVLIKAAQERMRQSLLDG